jgi:hypothetical protein
MLRSPTFVWVGVFAMGCGSSDSGGASDAAGDSAVVFDSATSDSTRDTPSGDASDTSTPSDSIADALTDSIAIDSGAGPDAADGGDAGDPLASLVGCLGTSATLTVSSQMPYMNVPVGSESGEFVIDFGSTFSSIDLHAFAPPGPSTSGCDPTKLGVTCTVDGFAFFAPPGPVFLVTENFSGISGSVRQAGIVGTDFTSLKIITLSYAGGRIFASPSAGFCDDSALIAAGFGAVTMSGFFSNDLSTLSPMSSVDSTATSGHVPNVPTVPVRVAGASAVAQLDTGFDDALVHFSVNVNPAYRDAILAADSGALVRDASHDLTLSTCTGASESVQAYKMGAGRTFDFVGPSGSAVRSVSGATIFVKTSSPKACGGIGTWTVPAAQIAASFFVDMGALVFDPYSSRVWMPH